MKRVVLCLLLLLAACQAPKPVVEDQQQVTPPLDLNGVLDQFKILDRQLDTLWRQEQIPDNLIDQNAIKPWTASMLFLKDRLASQNNTALMTVVDARIDMLRAEVAYYLINDIDGKVDVTIEDGEATVTNIDCAKKEDIEQYYKLYGLAYKYYEGFVEKLDGLSQESVEMRQVFADQNRPAFYDSRMGAVEKTLIAVSQALATC